MKRKPVLVMALLTMFTLSFASCTKSNDGPGKDVPPAPDVAVGAWQFGSASMTEIWDNSTNSFLGNAFELSVRFNFRKDGTYDQYFVAGSRALGGCRTNVFNIESGTVTFDEANGTFTTYPTKVKNKYYNCGTVSNSEKTKDIKGGTYSWRKKTASNGTPVLEIRTPEGQNFSTFYKQ